MAPTFEPTHDLLLDRLIKEAPDDAWWRTDEIRKASSWAQVQSMKPEERAALVVRALDRMEDFRPKVEALLSKRDVGAGMSGRSMRPWNVQHAVAREAGRTRLPFTLKQLERIASLIHEKSRVTTTMLERKWMLIKQLESRAPEIASSKKLQDWLERYANEVRRDGDNPALLRRIQDLLGTGAQMPLEAGEAWSDAAIDSVGKANQRRRDAWIALLSACAASPTSPSGRWIKESFTHVTQIGADAFAESLIHWLPLVDKPRTQPRPARSRWESDWTNRIIETHTEVLKALCWLASTIENPDLARALGKLAISCYRKIPGLGPRAVKVGNAAVYALGQMRGMDSVGQLAMLRVNVKFGTAQKLIEKALNAAAARENLPRDEIEELAVPSYGLTEVGKRVENLGGHRVEIVIERLKPELRFFKDNGKPAKSAPAALKKDHAEDLKELKSAMKDIASMLPAQRDRIDAMFLQNKSWSFPTWRERYLDHPLVGVIARRLIWSIADGKGASPRAVTWLDSAKSLVDVEGKPTTCDESSAIVRLWHPIEAPQPEVLAWRRYFEDRQIRQPFKQAHREVYILTDAERTTGTYSNRFAAHIIRQHQFHALAAVRGWKNKLRLLVDAEYPPASRELPAWNLRAEFWIEGAGDQYGQHTNESGAYLYLTTDQVRFYPVDAAQATAHAGGGGYGARWGGEAVAHGLSLDLVPPLVFSEIMRDVDLFVGVGSVGNNPEWADGGPDGRFQGYWQSYSFGELSETAKTRRDILQRLVPRLSIAPVCSISDKFLSVRGTLRTYKIHLGSGNILMEPNDQYLCIVPSRSGEIVGAAPRAGASDIFLPFEGDRTLSIILSKAFMLAEDTKIKDPSITQQIKA